MTDLTFHPWSGKISSLADSSITKVELLLKLVKALVLASLNIVKLFHTYHDMKIPLQIILFVAIACIN